MIEDGQVDNVGLSSDVLLRWTSGGQGLSFYTKKDMTLSLRTGLLSKTDMSVEEGQPDTDRVSFFGTCFGANTRTRVRGACSKIYVNATTPSASATAATCSLKRAADTDKRTVGALARIVLVTWLTEQDYLPKRRRSDG
jgi:hypothetical protein